MSGDHDLKPMLGPKSVAVVGASDTPGKVGTSIFRNLLEHRFTGNAYPVNFRSSNVAGIRAYQSLSELPERVDLAVLCTPASTIPGLIDECGRLRIPAALVITAGFREIGQTGSALEQQFEQALSRNSITRILGPNCLGLIHPASRLSASFAKGMPQPGSLAFLSQSGALCTAFLDWSLREGIGFSHFVSLGNQLDIGFADLLDALADDPSTTAAILYIESITKPDAFIAAARKFACRKPLIAYKGGRFAESAHAAASHTGALAGVDAVYQAVFDHCGIVRVDDMESMIECAELLSQYAGPIGERIAIVTNAGGPGVMATDTLLAAGGRLTQLTPETSHQLDQCLPSNWSHGNPVDVIGDATPERYTAALQWVLQDPQVDTVLAILTPQAMTNPTETAERISSLPIPSGKRLVTSWMGGDSMREGIERLQQAGIRNFETPESAVRGLMRLITHFQSQHKLTQSLQIPRADIDLVLDPKLGEEFKDQRIRFIEEVTTERRQPFGSHGLKTGILNVVSPFLTEVESKQLLQRYGIPTPPIAVAQTPDEAVEIAHGYELTTTGNARAQKSQAGVVIKLHSLEITHKTDVGGVMLNVRGEEQVRQAFSAIQANIKMHAPTAKWIGVTVQPMVVKKDGVELLLGSKRDPVFGPVVLLGFGGILAELVVDRQIGLPPIGHDQAEAMLRKLRCFPLLDGYRGRCKANLAELSELIVRYSQLIQEQDWIQESDLNPICVDGEGAMVLDARFILRSDR